MATSANSSSDLLAAVRGYDLDRLKKILQSGVDPNINRGKDYSLIPLLVAAWNGKVEMVKCLLQFKADVHIENENGRTALHWAACKGDADIVELLISHGADVNKQSTSGGWTALHDACYRGHVACVRILLEHGADVALRTRDGKTARDKAVEKNKADVVKLLDDFVWTKMNGLQSMCDTMAGELRHLKEKQSELDLVKAELASLKAEMKQLSAMNAKMAQLLASKAELDQLSTLKTEVTQLATLKKDVAQLSISKAEVDQLSTLKTEMDQLSTLKTEVTQLSASKADVSQLSTLRAEVAQLSTLKAEVDQLSTLKTAVEQHSNDLSSLVEELFPKEAQPKPTPSIDAQLRSISQRQDFEDNWWNIGKELGFSRREMMDFAAKYNANDDSMQPAIHKMLQTWCENSACNDDDAKLREIWRILGISGVRGEE